MSVNVASQVRHPEQSAGSSECGSKANFGDVSLRST